MNLEINKIYEGDALAVLRDFPAECVDMVLTSPPYDNLRTYSLDKFVVWRDNVSYEDKQAIIKEIKEKGIKPVITLK